MAPSSRRPPACGANEPTRASRRRAWAPARRTTWRGRGLRSSRQLGADVALGRDRPEGRRTRHGGCAGSVDRERIAVLARIDEAEHDIANAADAEHAVPGVCDDD